MKKRPMSRLVLLLGIAFSLATPLYSQQAIDLEEFTITCTKRTFSVGILGFLSIPVTSISCDNGFSEVYFM